MDVLTSIKAGFKWLVILTLVLSLFINYRLFRYSSELRQSNQQLAQTLEAQQKNNDHLAMQIESLKQDKQQAQLVQDEMINQERQARLALERRITQLKKELAHAPCNHEPIDYPANWVSGY